MRTWHKTWALAFGLGLLGAGTARAHTNPSDNQDSLTLTVSPRVNYSIDIDTAGATLNMGAVDLGQSTWTVRPATVTFGGDITLGHEADLSAVISGGWQFNASGSVSTATAGGMNLLNLYALFTSTNLAAAPAGAVFGDPDGTDAPETRAAIAPGTAGTTFSSRVGANDSGAGTHSEPFECNVVGACRKDMYSVDLNSSGTNSRRAHLWFFMRLPGSTNTGSTQSITVTLTHTLGDI